MPGQFDLQNNFPVASVADLIAQRPYKEQQMRAQQQGQLVQGLQDFSSGVNSLVQRRNQMAQALTLGKNLGMAPEEVQGLTPEQVIQAAVVKKGYLDPAHLLAGMGITAPGATMSPMVNSASGPAPVSSTGGPMLTSNNTATPMPPTPSTGTAPSPAPSVATPGSSVPIPVAAPPTKPVMLSPAEQNFIFKAGAAARANRPENVMTQDAALQAGVVPKGTKILNPSQGNSDKKEQDAYWRDAVSGIRSIRGDTPMKDIESQRNSAIVAYNRLSSLDLAGKGVNPIDYVDILGQIYKARTGTAPTQEVLKEAKQTTAQGQFGKFYTYFTGQQMPATSKDIASSLKDMVAHMGIQADDLHEGYMQVHGAGVFNPNMDPANVQKLSKIARGKSFTEATGVKPEDFDQNVKAIKWAHANPNDPDAPAVLKKAMDAMNAKGGTNIGL